MAKFCLPGCAALRLVPEWYDYKLLPHLEMLILRANKDRWSRLQLWHVLNPDISQKRRKRGKKGVAEEW